MRYVDWKPVQPDGRAKWLGLTAVGVQLVGMLGNLGGYPLKVLVNGGRPDQAELLLPGPGIEPIPTGVASLEIVEAVPGDKYELYVAPTSQEGRQYQATHDARGATLVRDAGLRTLAVVNLGPSQDINVAPAFPADGSASSHFLFLKPGPSPTFVAQPATGDILAKYSALLWDLSGFRGVRLSLSLDNRPSNNVVPDFTTILVPRLFVYAAHPTADTVLDMWEAMPLPLFSAKMGSTGDFAYDAAGGAPPPELTGAAVGMVELGAHVESSSSYMTRDARRASLALIAIEKEVGKKLTTMLLSYEAAACQANLTLEAW